PFAAGCAQHAAFLPPLQRRGRAAQHLALCNAHPAGLGTVWTKTAPASRMNANLKAGLLAAGIALAADQASKLYLLFVYDIAARGAVQITPFFDLVLTWNKGISYGWFQAETAAAQALLLAINLP